MSGDKPHNRNDDTSDSSEGRSEYGIGFSAGGNYWFGGGSAGYFYDGESRARVTVNLDRINGTADFSIDKKTEYSSDVSLLSIEFYAIFGGKLDITYDPIEDNIDLDISFGVGTEVTVNGKGVGAHINAIDLYGVDEYVKSLQDDYKPNPHFGFDDDGGSDYWGLQVDKSDKTSGGSDLSRAMDEKRDASVYQFNGRGNYYAGSGHPGYDARSPDSGGSSGGGSGQPPLPRKRQPPSNSGGSLSGRGFMYKITQAQFNRVSP